MTVRTWSSVRCLIFSGKVGRVRATSWAVMDGIRDMASVTLPGAIGVAMAAGIDRSGAISSVDECPAGASGVDAVASDG